MGWTSERYTKGRPLRDFFADRFNSEHGKLLNLAVVNRSVAYGAWQVTKPDKKPYVIGLVILIRFDHGDICYKEMEETVGPCENHCPERILKLLSPLEEIVEPGSYGWKWAVSWRIKAQEHINKVKVWNKVKAGTVIRTRRPILFSSGAYYDLFFIESKKPLRFYEWTGQGVAGLRLLMKANVVVDVGFDVVAENVSHLN